MTDESRDQTRYGLFQELIRRRMFRSAGAYVMAGWILVEVASIVFPEFSAPSWALRALIIMLIAGFPFAMVVAWTLDLTASGIVRTKQSHFSKTREGVLQVGILAGATILSAGVLWWVWADYVQPSTQRPTRAAIKENPIVAVSAPRMLSGSDQLAWLGQGIADLVRNELAESPHLVVLSASGWNKISGNVESKEQMVELARQASIDYLVAGQYLQTPDGIVLTIGIEDLENEIEIQGVRLVEADATTLVSASSAIFKSVRQALQIPLEENVKRFAADFVTRNMDAYEAYIAGLGFFIGFEYQEAEQAFRAALSLAPDYHMARFRLAEVLESSGRSEQARRELDRIPEDAPLTDRERLYVEGAKSMFIYKRDVDRAIDIYRELTEKYPYDMEAGQLLADAYWLAFDEAAAIREFRRLAEVHSYDPAAWMALGERLLDVGELDEAEIALVRYAQAEEIEPFAHALLGRLSLLRGNASAAIESYQRSLQLKPGFVVATLGIARSLYLDGDFDEAEVRWRSLIDDSDAAAQYRIDAAFDLVGVLRGQGRFMEAIEVLESVEAPVREEGLFTATMLSTIGLLHLELGDSARAETLIDAALAESPDVATRHLFARGLLEIRMGQFGSLVQTVDEIRSLALPPDDPDRTEDKAASYLLGLAALASNDLDRAGAYFDEALSKDGYEYAMYALGHATYLAETGDLHRAADVARSAVSARDPSELRLDLEVYRNRAARLYAEVLAKLQR